jgi:hypothetical protein
VEREGTDQNHITLFEMNRRFDAFDEKLKLALFDDDCFVVTVPVVIAGRYLQ